MHIVPREMSARPQQYHVINHTAYVESPMSFAAWLTITGKSTSCHTCVWRCGRREPRKKPGSFL